MEFLRHLNYFKTRIDINEYANTLFDNQNDTDDESIKNLLSKKDYLIILKEVLEIVKQNPYADSITIRNKLFEQSGLKDAIYNLVYEKNLTPGLVLTFGTKNITDTITCGNKSEFTLNKHREKISYITPVEHNTIYDIASTSKLITCAAMYKLRDENLLDFDESIRKYLPELDISNEISLYDYLKFNVDLQTNGRVDSAKTFEEAEKILFTAKATSNTYLDNAYTDIGAMLLKYVVERVIKMPFHEFAKEVIFIPLKMDDTFLKVPEDKIHRVASNNFNKIVDLNGNIVEETTLNLGISHDPKAKIIKSKLNNAPGHAGYFSTALDLDKFAQGLLDGTVISRESLLDISKSKTCTLKLDKNGKNYYTRRYGSLTYGKHINPNYLAVQAPLSGKAFMSPGFCGSEIVIDPLNDLHISLASNRLHNRIYKIPTDFVEEKGTKKMYQGSVVSSTYAIEKEEVIKIAVKLSLQYQFLETFKKNSTNKQLIREL